MCCIDLEWVNIEQSLFSIGFCLFATLFSLSQSLITEIACCEGPHLDVIYSTSSISPGSLLDSDLLSYVFQVSKRTTQTGKHG